MTDAIQSAIQYALHGLSDRKTVTTNNLANLETPNYLAGQTDFETSLKSALSGDQSVSLNPVHKTSLAETNLNGNNVSLDNESLTSIDTELRYQAMVEAMSTKFKLLRSAVGGS
jgi:flagellar basal-body rod protein FlgB